MFGIIYLLMSILTGREVTALLQSPGKDREEMYGSRIWLTFPASFGTGTLLMTWVVYLISWGASAAGVKQPLLAGNAAAMGACAAVLLLVYIRRKKRKLPVSPWKGDVGEKACFFREALFFALLLVFVTWMMFYTFHIRDGRLYCGFTVYGDYAPHTAMMRSFSLGDNFPTQYPHFGGEDVKYHFMFQFLAGNLEYLGMRLDLAYNSVSILALLGFFMLLYKLARRLGGGPAAGILAVVFTVFRSGTAFFRFAWEHLKAGDLLQTLAANTSFIGYTANEDWGLWNFNVYLNQRHLAFGLILVLLSLWIFMDWAEAGNAHEEKGLCWMRDRLFTKGAWKSRNLDTALLTGMLLGLTSFWNGAAVIGGLLILLGFALFSDGKLDYAVMAGVTVFLSLLQTKIFISGEAVAASVYFGFLAENKTIMGILWYLFQISGFFFLGLAVLAFFFRRMERIAMAAFLFPAVFAFFASLTPDVNVNHKYIMISYTLTAVFWGIALTRLWRKRAAGQAAALILTVCLTATGIYDFVVILKDNDSGHRVSVNLESGLTRWLAENTDKDDLILTPEYSIHEVTMSGVMLYLGWPYYAWSAGYDTYYRAEKAVEIYTTADRDVLQRTVEEEGITYILYEEGMEFEQNECREDVIAEVYPEVYRSEDGRIRIYETAAE